MGTEPPVTGARFIDADTIIALGNDGTARTLDATGRTFRKLPTIGRGLRLAGFDQDSRKAVFYSPSGMVAITGDADKVKRIGVTPPLRNVAIIPGLIATLSKVGISFFTISGQRAGSPRTTFGAATAIAFAANEQLFAEAGGFVWSLKRDSPDNVKLFKTPISSVTAMATDNNELLAFGNSEGTISISNVGGHVVDTLKGHRGAIRDIRFSHDHRSIATASADSTVRIWHITVVTVPNTFTGIATSIANRTTACLSAPERSLLLGESASDAQSNVGACEKKHGRVYAPPARAGL